MLLNNYHSRMYNRDTGICVLPGRSHSQWQEPMVSGRYTADLGCHGDPVKGALSDMHAAKDI